MLDEGIRRKDGSEITIGMINRIVRSPIYIGIIQRGESKSEVLPELKIIDESLYLRAQEIISARKVQRRDVPLTTRGQSLLVGNVYCGCCGARLVLATSGHQYTKKDGTVVSHTYSGYRCHNRVFVPGKCDNQTTFGVEKLDNLVDQIIRIQLAQIQKAPPQALLEKQQKEKDYQALRAETLKVIRGTSQLNADLLNSLITETEAELKDLENQMRAAEQELKEDMSGAEQVRKEYAQLMDWSELYDNCSFEAKKMIVAQFVKAVHVKRGYEVNIEFNVSFDEFQTLYLEPETRTHKQRKAKEILTLTQSCNNEA